LTWRAGDSKAGIGKKPERGRKKEDCRSNYKGRIQKNYETDG
jgi:hypothetical protein